MFLWMEQESWYKDANLPSFLRLCSKETWTNSEKEEEEEEKGMWNPPIANMGNDFQFLFAPIKRQKNLFCNIVHFKNE